MSHTVHAFDYLAAPHDFPPAAMCVLFGDEPLLKRLVLERLRANVLGDEADDVPYATFDGEEAEWRPVHDEVGTVSLFGSGKRLAVVDNADSFVSNYREQLEKYLSHPARGSVLVLQVGSWAANTRLYKATDQQGLQIDCRPPQRKVGGKNCLDEYKVRPWLVERARSGHGIRISKDAVGLLLELVGTELGLVDQEFAKLALYADKSGRVSPDLVRDVAGGWRTKTTWDIADFAADGKAAEALAQLDKLLAAGETPQALFGSISWSLRRYAAATRVYERAEREGSRVTLETALRRAGVKDWPQGELKKTEGRLRQLGRQRAGMLYRWLLETDLAMKGTHSDNDRARWLLEQLFVRLSQAAQPRR